MHIVIGGRVKSRKKGKNSGVYYSATYGDMCSRCDKPVDDCTCGAEKGGPRGDGIRGDGIVRITRSTKGRKGKTVTVLTGFALADDALRELAKELKQRCGAGGTSRDGTIEIQGEHRETLVSELRKRGYRNKGRDSFYPPAGDS